jgi:hypothetical protein
MRARVLSIAAVVILLASVAMAAGKSVTGIELSQFDGHDVLVFRTSGGVGIPSTYSRDIKAGTISFTLPANPSAAKDDARAVKGELVRAVELAVVKQGAKVKVAFTKPELADPAYFRFSAPSDHVIVLEVFPLKGQRQEAPLFDVEQWIAGATDGAPKSDSKQAQPARVAKPRQESGAAFAGNLGIPSLDLRAADANRVLGLAANAGLLKLRGRASVATEPLGSISVRPGGQSLMGWTEATPPGEVYLAGSPEQIAEFMQYADPRFIGGQPTLIEEWLKQRPQAADKPVLGGRSAATRSRIKDDPAGGLFYDDYNPGGVQLSDIRVTLNASNGLNLYDVLSYLSEVSGISLIIDPYAFDDPTGSKRAPLPPDGQSTEDEPGFRQGGIFQPQFMRTGSVRGNFVNVPFDQFLEMVLTSHDLVYAVQGAPGNSDSGYGDSTRGPGGGTRDSYDKPVILVTSPQRLNYELDGTNEINLQQFHYADPSQVAQILDQFGMMADVNTGWFIYQGGGNNNGSGQGGGGTGGNGGSGGGFGGGTTSRQADSRPDILVFRGNSRGPVEQAVQKAHDAGQSVVHVRLASERNGQLVTLFANAGKGG